LINDLTTLAVQESHPLSLVFEIKLQDMQRDAQHGFATFG
jgi:hypothetical protein